MTSERWSGKVLRALERAIARQANEAATMTPRERGDLEAAQRWVARMRRDHDYQGQRRRRIAEHSCVKHPHDCGVVHPL